MHDDQIKDNDGNTISSNLKKKGYVLVDNKYVFNC